MNDVNYINYIKDVIDKIMTTAVLFVVLYYLIDELRNVYLVLDHFYLRIKNYIKAWILLLLPLLQYHVQWSNGQHFPILSFYFLG